MLSIFRFGLLRTLLASSFSSDVNGWRRTSLVLKIMLVEGFECPVKGFRYDYFRLILLRALFFSIGNDHTSFCACHIRAFTFSCLYRVPPYMYRITHIDQSVLMFLRGLVLERSFRHEMLPSF